MDIEEKKKQVERLVIANQKLGQRKGQALFNAIAVVDPLLANRLSGTEVDCFYNDKACKIFRKEVYKAFEIGGVDQMEDRVVWDYEAAGSNPAAPTNTKEGR